MSTGLTLEQIERINASGAKKCLEKVKIIVMYDVENPYVIPPMQRIFWALRRGPI